MKKFNKVLIIIIWFIGFISVLINMSLERELKEVKAENENLKNKIMEVR